MAKEKLRTGNFGGFSKKSISDNLINKGKESTNKDLEKLKKEKAAQTIENKKRAESLGDKEEAPQEQPKVVVPLVEETTTEVSAVANETPKGKDDNSVDDAKIEKETTSISLDKDVLTKMQMYCKANKISLSGEINKYLKNQYIPKKKVDEFFKNMFK